MINRTAIVFGGTGLTGSHLVKMLTEDDFYQTIKTFTRRTVSNLDSKKIEQLLFDPMNLSDCSENITGDDLYICLGTTIKKAGSQPAFEAIDLELPKQILEIAKKNGIKRVSVISSLGANPESSNFYLRTKGKMEKAVMTSGINYWYIFRPSLLLGKRDEKRIAENISKALFPIFSLLLVGKLRKYRAIQSLTVAKAMRLMMFSEKPSCICESDEIEKISAS